MEIQKNPLVVALKSGGEDCEHVGIVMGKEGEKIAVATKTGTVLHTHEELEVLIEDVGSARLDAVLPGQMDKVVLYFAKKTRKW